MDRDFNAPIPGEERTDRMDMRHWGRVPWKDSIEEQGQILIPACPEVDAEARRQDLEAAMPIDKELAESLAQAIVGRRQDVAEECRRAVEKWRARKERRARILGNAVIALMFAIWATGVTLGILWLLGKI